MPAAVGQVDIVSAVQRQFEMAVSLTSELSELDVVSTSTTLDLTSTDSDTFRLQCHVQHCILANGQRDVLYGFGFVAGLGDYDVVTSTGSAENETIQCHRWQTAGQPLIFFTNLCANNDRHSSLSRYEDRSGRNAHAGPRRQAKRSG